MFVLFVGERGETQVSSQAKVHICSASTVAGIPVVVKFGGHVGGAFQVCFLVLCLNLRTYRGIFRRICEEFPCSAGQRGRIPLQMHGRSPNGGPLECPFFPRKEASQTTCFYWGFVLVSAIAKVVLLARASL